MDYTILIRDTLERLGFELAVSWNALTPPYQQDTGWSLNLPQVDFGPRTLVVLHFQDFVTSQTVIEIKKVEQAYGANADRVLIVHDTLDIGPFYSGPVNLIRYSSHSHITAARVKNRMPDWLPAFRSTQRQGWMSLNGRDCDHRQQVADTVKSWPNGTLSYGSKIPLPQHDYRSYPGTENDENFVRLASIYARHPVNIVTESQYQGPGMITEKTLLAMVACQVPVIISHQHCLAQAQALGFDLFDDIVDTAYDTLDDTVRLKTALESNRDLCIHGRDFASYRARLFAQRDFVLNKYPELMANRFKNKARQLALKLLSTQHVDESSHVAV
jgi:hypothetical protein